MEHVKAMPDALRIKLSPAEINRIHDASPFEPLFPMSFLFNFRGDQPYHLGLTAADNEQYQMTAQVQAPPKQPPYEPYTRE